MIDLPTIPVIDNHVHHPWRVTTQHVLAGANFRLRSANGP
jgi:hypothetical protein